MLPTWQTASSFISTWAPTLVRNLEPIILVHHMGALPPKSSSFFYLRNFQF
ncbi:hypothetical protein NC653_004348 [Populus alba x Populus x berolinensis]|uniref:Uncharacterized protein n=1 Tax=Populus alba x Populus x berolinensis TaxID=444605 RepID=A0AAD6RW37_9ROSI|nr:hypothetical protein NC653_004348 [Populus alba x Populus x berolinensis]